MEKAFLLLCAVFILFSCSDNESSLVNEETVSTSVTTTAFAEDTSSDQQTEDFSSLTAKFISYIDEKLTYEYNGEQKTVNAPLMLFGEEPSIGEPNTFKVLKYLIETGSDIKVELSFENGALRFVDVFKPNNIEYFDNRSFHEYMKLTNPKVEDAEMHLERHGSKVTLTGNYGSVECDINDLNSRSKGNIPEEADRIVFTGIKLPDGHIILEHLAHFDHEEEGKYGKEISYAPYFNSDQIMFCGTVQSLADERATVLLNDGKTTCDVPTYYNDGEMKEGQRVLVTLEADKSLYNSGEQYKADYAVFITHLEWYGGEEYDFSQLAYAQPNKERVDGTILTFADGTTGSYIFKQPTKFRFTTK